MALLSSSSSPPPSLLLDKNNNNDQAYDPESPFLDTFNQHHQHQHHAQIVTPTLQPFQEADDDVCACHAIEYREDDQCRVSVIRCMLHRRENQIDMHCGCQCWSGFKNHRFKRRREYCREHVRNFFRSRYALGELENSIENLRHEKMRLENSLTKWPKEKEKEKEGKKNKNKNSN